MHSENTIFIPDVSRVSFTVIRQNLACEQALDSAADWVIGHEKKLRADLLECFFPRSPIAYTFANSILECTDTSERVLVSSLELRG